MKSQLNPTVVVVVIVVLVVGLVAYFMKSTAGVAPGTGRTKIELYTGKFANDPEGMKKSLQESYDKYKASQDKK